MVAPGSPGSLVGGAGIAIVAMGGIPIGQQALATKPHSSSKGNKRGLVVGMYAQVKTEVV